MLHGCYPRPRTQIAHTQTHPRSRMRVKVRNTDVEREKMKRKREIGTKKEIKKDEIKEIRNLWKKKEKTYIRTMRRAGGRRRLKMGRPVGLLGTAPAGR